MLNPSRHPVSLRVTKDALWTQIPTIVLCALLLDQGRVLRVCLIATLGYWLFALFIVVRNGTNVDPLGSHWMRWGYFPLFLSLLYLNGVLHLPHSPLPNLR